MAEQNDDLLPGGLRFFNPNDAAPDFVVGSLVITMNELFEYCKKHPELVTEYQGKKQLKVQMLLAKSGKLYGKVDNYKKEETPAGKAPPSTKTGGAKAAPAEAAAPPDDDLPF